MSEEKEEWKDIKDYEGLYQISNFGRVKSLNYLNTKQPRILKPKTYRGGYLCVCLSKNGVVKYPKIHRLVYDNFIGIDKPYKRRGKGNEIWVINHKDENRTNNRLDNLELITQTENVNYGSAKEKQSKVQRNNRKTSYFVYQYSKDFVLIKVWPSTRECHRHGFDCRRISDCCNNKGHQEDKREYKGYLWSYSKL